MVHPAAFNLKGSRIMTAQYDNIARYPEWRRGQGNHGPAGTREHSPVTAFSPTARAHRHGPIQVATEHLAGLKATSV
jgi:hypothetical protein